MNSNYPYSNRRFTMKYTKEQRLDIGRQIYDREITKFQASEIYDISVGTAREYMRLYRDTNHLPKMKKEKPSGQHESLRKQNTEPAGLEDYAEMSKDELIRELVRARIREARLKKGYEVKGDGSIVRYGKKNTR